ncbi:MAG TPA: hypothetical protein VGR62_07570 [Candidatus Binatia bacterium]|jgi:DNA-binding beta-propeller fold protein YncE|nr:hypothetical protein [Candidatus Binatia bacterium]
MQRNRPLLIAVTTLLAAITTAARADFVNFETGQVRPMAMSPDGSRLFAVNTPDDRLEVFAIGAAGLTHTGSVSVGLQPVAIAARTDGEVWVVNHLSDSISIVDVASSPPRVVRTILTCDEPRDIVFAGPGNARAFVTTARRGQNCPVNFNPNQEGTPRAIVQVWDATALDGTLAGTPIANLELFGDTPRALARSADGSTVYAAIFQSGNQTTSITEGAICDGGAASSPCGAFQPGGLPAPNINVEGIVGPEVGLIVKFNQTTSLWEDTLGRNWSGVVRFELPDTDVFAIDASAALPIETANFAHVGTVLFNMVTNPVSGTVYVSNTDARNEVRFEGFGDTFGNTTVQGRLHESRITVIDGGGVHPRHLNKHIDYDVHPAPPGVKQNSLATPLDMAISSDGTTLYVAAFGSSKIGVFDTAALEADTFTPSAADHITVSGGGPTGILLDEARNRLYAFTRFDDAISVIDLATRTETSHVAVYNPEPAVITAGRPFLYDANLTSNNGEASCSSCHVFGDLDSLGWDLGDPDGLVVPNPIPTKIPALPPAFVDFHPLKGPMTTQSLRGMANHGSMHWRGDRTGGNDVGGDAFDEVAAFSKFNPAFVGLVGRDAELTDEQMLAFTEFVLTVTYPPNPIRRLNQTLTANEQLGRDLFFGRVTDVLFNCDGCHRLDPALGFFGSDGFSTFEGETQMFKVPHLRNVYTKVGMFGRPGEATNLGPQVRGYGVLHDGSLDTVRRFLGSSVFSLTNMEQNNLERFVFAMDSNMAPIVGQQVTLTATNLLAVDQRIDLMLERDDALECEVVVKAIIGGLPRGAYRLPDGTFQLDRVADVMTEPALRALATTPGQELTYTCAPPGSGARIGVDRDGDGYFDRDELDAGSSPTDPTDVPIPATLVRASSLTLTDDPTPPFTAAKRKLSFRSAKYQGTSSGVIVPAWDTDGDPTLHGARLAMYDADGGTTLVTFELPAGNWERIGSVTKPGYKYVDKKALVGPINAITVREGTLSVKGKGASLYPLTSAPQGSVAVRLDLGTTVRLCTAAPAKDPGSKNDTTSKFLGARNTPAPAACPDRP